MSIYGHFYVSLMMRKTESHILIIDDDEDVQFAARVYLQRFFTKVSTLSSPKVLLNMLKDEVIDVILLDMNYRKGIQDGREGMYWLKEFRTHTPETTVVMMTAYSDVTLAVDSIKEGAFDFVLKPWNNEKLLATIYAAVKQSRLLKKSNRFSSLNQEVTPFDQQWVLGESTPFKQVLNMVNKVADTDANVLILGENGTGKYVIAKMLHNKSQRKNEAFIHIDLGSLSENLFESELYGYVQGAFTDAQKSKIGRFELAEKGTLFLDEIGNLPVNLQAKLLSAIQRKKIVRLGESKERTIDVRIICATNSNLPIAIQEGQFRQDLYYRINTVEMTIPPLRDRKEDIEAFCAHFLEKYKRKYKKTVLQFSSNAIDALTNYSWPGNIRELEHLIERLVILSEGEVIQKDQLQLSSHSTQSKEVKTLNLDENEKFLIEQSLKKHAGNVSKAAKELGLTRGTLYRRMEKHNL